MTAPLTHAVPGMSFDDARLAKRRETLGASEIGAVCGLDRYRSPLDVYLDKRGLVPPFEGNQFTEWGLRLEGAIAQKYAEVTGLELSTSDTVVNPERPWMSATPDRLVQHSPAYGLEIKRFGEHKVEEFGAELTDQVPLTLAAQCQWSMAVTGLRRWDVAVLLGQAEFRRYQLAYDPEIADTLIDLGAAFWSNHVLPGVEPAIEGEYASLSKMMARRFPTHDTAMLPATTETLALAAALRRVKTEMTQLEFKESELTAKLQRAIGEHAGIEGVATWKVDKVGRVNWKHVATLCKPSPALIRDCTGFPGRRFMLKYSEDR